MKISIRLILVGLIILLAAVILTTDKYTILDQENVPVVFQDVAVDNTLEGVKYVLIPTNYNCIKKQSLLHTSYYLVPKTEENKLSYIQNSPTVRLKSLSELEDNTLFLMSEKQAIVSIISRLSDN